MSHRPHITYDLHMVEFISYFQAKHGYPPSVRDIGRALGIASTSVVYYRLRRLERRGYIQIAGGIARGIVVVE